MMRSGAFVVLARRCVALTILTLGLTASAHSDDLVGKIGGSTIKEAETQLAAIASETVKEFLDRAEAISNDLLRKGTTSASLLTVQAGNEMKILTATARTEFGNEMTTQVNSASIGLKPLLVHLQRWELSLDWMKDQLVELEDLIALDLLSLPFSSAPLSIRKVSGGVFVEGKNDTYVIEVVGKGFGQDPAGTETKFSARLNGRALSAAPDRTSSPIKAIFKIDPDLTKGLFDKEKLVTVPFELSVSRSEPAWYSFWGFFLRKSNVELKNYHVSLLPSYAGKVAITTTRTAFGWAAFGKPGEQTYKLRDDFPITIKVDSPQTKAAPEPDNKRINRNIVIACIPDLQPGRRFPSGRVFPASSEIFKKGHTSPGWIGAKDRQPGDWALVDSQFKALFGFSVYLPSRCQESEHCTIRPNELLSHSTEELMDVSGCTRMKLDERSIAWSSNDSLVSFILRGKVELAADEQRIWQIGDALWRATYQEEIYKPKAEPDTDDVKSLPVYASLPLEFDVLTPGRRATSTSIEFKPTIGHSPNKTFVPNDIVKGNFRFMHSDTLDDRVKYSYQFEYKTK